MGYLLAFPILFITMMLQMVVINKIPLLYGYADLVVLVIVVYAMHPKANRAWFWGLLAMTLYGYVSKIPYFVPIIVFSAIIISAQYIKKRIWQMPLIAFIFVIISASLLFQILSLGALVILGSSLPIMESINLIVIPSVMLNLIFSVPIYFIFNDFLDIVFTEKEKI